MESIKGTVSYNDLAAKSSCDSDCDASRQAFYYRTNEEAVEFFRQILAAVMKHKHELIDIATVELNGGFKRILVQDSTIIRLPDKLFERFSGVKNALTTVCNARIQGIYDLLAGKFVSFSIDTYSENDLLAAHKIPIQEGDLVLRDRGYFVLSSIENMKIQGADSIIRYKHKTIFYDPDSLEEIDLLKLLQMKGSLDIRVVCGVGKNIKLRVLASAVPQEVANIRRMKAKKEAKSRGCSYELLQLLGWTIFITTIEDQTFTIQQACQLYSLRWRIECIFKTWKSNLSFGKIHDVSDRQLRILLHARFIMITILYEKLYKPLEIMVFTLYGRPLSLMKFMRYLSRNLINFSNQYFDARTKDCAIKKAARYCTYEKRNRANFMDKMKFMCLT
jgi:hypothetical protein